MMGDAARKITEREFELERFFTTNLTAYRADWQDE
jgi:hypothetical protein